MMNASGGRIKVDTYSCDVLVPAAENMTSCGSGMVDMVLGYGGYWEDLVPIATLESGAPFGWQHRDEAFAFYYECGFIELLRQAYAEQNCYFIAPIMNSTYTLMSAKEFHNLEEWKGVKTRVAGITAELFNSLDIPTTYVPGSELYLAMSTGTIDAFAWCCPYTYYLMKYYEIADYIIEPAIFSVINNCLLINLDLWNSLPDDIKEIVEVSAKANLIDAASYWVSGNTEGLSYMREQGVGVITLPTEDVEVLTAASMELLDVIAEKDATYTAPAVKALKVFLSELGYL